MPHRSARTLCLLFVAGLGVSMLSTTAQAADPKVSWSDTNAKAGTEVTARVGNPPKASTLVLQRKFPDGWQGVDDATAKHGRARLQVPTDQFGSFTFRVVAKDGSSVSTLDTQAITVRPPYDPPGSASAYTITGTRTRWDSCKRITWAFNPHHAPGHALSQLKEGISRIHAATGLEFKYVGRTSAKPQPTSSTAKKANITVGWRTARDFAAFRHAPQTAGIGGRSWYTGYREPDGSRVNRAFTGGVVFNANQHLGRGFGKGHTWGEVIIHELGHVMGLDHTDAKTQIMYYSTLGRNADWGAGDLTGLRKLGDTNGCLSRAGRLARVTPHSGSWR